tara:strand:+ start:10523 stop:11836 length:1314 start_codon:yes stop_codon:yes gene_type:complete
MLVIGALFLPKSLVAQDNAGAPLPSLETMRGQYQAMLEIVVEPLIDQEQLLFEQYAAAVERMKLDFESRGESDHAKAAAEEAELARTEFKSGDSAFPGIDAARAKLKAAQATIEAGKVPLMIPIRNQYVARLSELRSSLSNAGEVEKAMAVTEEMKRLASTRLDGPKPIAPPPPPPKVALREIRNSPLHRTERLTGEMQLQPGRYVLETPAHVGDRDIKGPDGLGNLVLRGPSELEGEVFVNRGSFNVTETRFHAAKLLANLGGTWEATACLFDGCTLNKAGGWYTKFYSSKWKFEDCVFAETFMKRLEHTPVGIQVGNCTFLDVEFPSVTFFEDAGKEALSRWRKVENCRFIGCTVPQSFLLITEGCLFEDCVFVDDENPINTVTELSTTIYAQPVASNRIVGRNWRILIEPADAVSQALGSAIDYVYEDGELRFR